MAFLGRLHRLLGQPEGGLGDVVVDLVAIDFRLLGGRAEDCRHQQGD